MVNVIFNGKEAQNLHQKLVERRRKMFDFRRKSKKGCIATIRHLQLTETIDELDRDAQDDTAE